MFYEDSADLENDYEVPMAHDRFFRINMQDLEVAEAFFKRCLSKEVLECIDFSTIRLEDSHFIRIQLGAFHNDILYSVTLGSQTGFLFLLTEHQSTPEKLMPFRMMNYTLLIMEKFKKEGEQKPYPLVLPIVLYHGREPYRYSTDILDLIDADQTLKEQYFAKSFLLVDVADIPDEVLKQNIYDGLMLLTLKRIYDTDILPFLREVIPILRKLQDEKGSRRVQTTLYYLLSEAEASQVDQVIEIINKKLPADIGENTVTIAQEIFQRGELRGISQTTERIAISMLQGNVDDETVAKYTQLTKFQLVALKALLAQSQRRDEALIT